MGYGTRSRHFAGFPSLLFVLLDLVRDLDLKQFSIDIGEFFQNLCAGLLFSSADFVNVPFFHAIKEGAIARLASAVRVVEVRVVARLVTDIALHVAAASLSAGHLVTAILLDERGAAC